MCTLEPDIWCVCKEPCCTTDTINNYLTSEVHTAVLFIMLVLSADVLPFILIRVAFKRSKPFTLEQKNWPIPLPYIWIIPTIKCWVFVVTSTGSLSPSFLSGWQWLQHSFTTYCINFSFQILKMSSVMHFNIAFYVLYKGLTNFSYNLQLSFVLTLLF